MVFQDEVHAKRQKRPKKMTAKRGLGLVLLFVYVAVYVEVVLFICKEDKLIIIFTISR
jgi:hypothetical protein